MKSLIVSLFVVAMALPAAALTPETEAYLKSIGLDPASEDVRLAEQAGVIQTTFMDEPVSYSVESLAAEKKKNGLIRFVTTRAFVAKLTRDPSVNVPENYESLYLTSAEKILVGKKLARSMLSGKKKAA
jgi:hypothetical protein